jgi:glycerophosphoryl diester phosphodiesterase
MHPLLDPRYRPVVGHRGNAGHSPENTLESFRQAVALGVDAIELDVHLSADGHVVVIHDPTLDRTTDRSGRVEQLTLAAIREADAGAGFTLDRGATFPWRARGIGVPLLGDVLEELRDTPCLIEIKTARVSAALKTLLERHDAIDRCLVAAFDHAAILPFRGAGFRTGCSRREAARLLPAALLGITVRTVPFEAMCITWHQRGVPLPVGGYVRTLAPAGVPVHVWTVDDPLMARSFWAKGVAGIITNEPAVILAERQPPGN